MDQILIKVAGSDMHLTPCDYRITTDVFAPSFTFDFTFYPHKDVDLRKLVNTTRPFTFLHIYFYDTDANSITYIMTGLVDRQSFGNSAGQVKVSGRDFRSLLVDSNVDPLFAIKDNEPLKHVFRRLISNFGIEFVDNGAMWDTLKYALVGSVGTVVDHIGKATSTDKKIEKNVGVYELLSDICKRSGITLLPGYSETTLCLSAIRPDYEHKIDSSILSIKRYLPDSENVKDNNVTDANIELDHTNIPTYWEAASHKVTIKSLVSNTTTQAEIAGFEQTLNDNSWVDVVGNQSNWQRARVKPGETIDKYKVYKPIFWNDSKAQNKKELTNTLAKMVSTRFKDSLTASYTLTNHSMNGAYWCIDTTIHVLDEMAQIDNDMYIKKVTYSGSSRGGTKTTIDLIRKYSVILAADEKAK